MFFLKEIIDYWGVINVLYFILEWVSLFRIGCKGHYGYSTIKICSYYLLSIFLLINIKFLRLIFLYLKEKSVFELFTKRNTFLYVYTFLSSYSRKWIFRLVHWVLTSISYFMTNMCTDIVTMNDADFESETEL